MLARPVSRARVPSAQSISSQSTAHTNTANGAKASGQTAACKGRLNARSNAATVTCTGVTPSLPLVWVFLRIGVTPTQVTVAALLLALSLPVQAWVWPLAVAPVAVFLSSILCQVMDCADGTLARLTGRASTAGRDLDFIVDMTQWGLLYVALGLIADRMEGGGFGWTALAMTAAWARLLARVVRDRLSDGGIDDETPAQPPKGAIEFVLVALAGMSGIIPFFALLGPWIPYAILFLLIYGISDVLEGAVPLVARLRQ